MSPAASSSTDPAPVPPQAYTAAGVCGFQAFLLFGAAAVFVIALVRGTAAEPTEAVMTLVVALVFATLLAVMAVHWWRGSRWPRTPTIVWNILMLPAAFTLASSSGLGVGIPFAIVALVGLSAAWQTPPPQLPEDTAL
ncbi:hypothetical protein GCM10027055_15140 [Janibacter alkaliphilus]|uniref:Membrane-anchored protein YejM (Alkaline phosphatase superfamily) n=1 Tax=Janibacter alkaliphilus TaxID=1069963 RepID=A0A852XG13_9MICO|nr:hypothetical protein [Janibacter alkaliphilus]NYG37495.1 membrane-anchored protein YejM (alkaline phosphatase superfamily) [Janibacter alkaliphilus]